MIDSVKEIRTVKASDLPPCFDIRVHNVDFPFEVTGSDENYVYLWDVKNHEDVYIGRDDMLTILVPDTWENAATDIELDLMGRGIL